MPTQVIHIRQAPKGWGKDPQYVYIGRGGYGLDGKWGNPFKVQTHGLGKCIDLYVEWINKPEQAQLKAEMKQLKGKTLICFCKPKACHGDVMASIAEEL